MAICSKKDVVAAKNQKKEKQEEKQNRNKGKIKERIAMQRVLATVAALALIERLKAKHGPLMFHQSGGCCDGSSPMCYPLGELQTGESDIELGHIGGCPFYMSRAQFKYWDHTQLIIDVTPGYGGMFSLEGPEGMRFLTRSRVFTEEEMEILAKT